MNVTYIILSIILVILLYVIYIYFSSSATTLATIVDCSLKSTYVDGSKLSNPTSSSFAYGLWIYIKDWATTTSSTNVTNIFYRTGIATTGTTKNTIHVFLEKNSPKMCVQFSNSAEGTNYSKVTTEVVSTTSVTGTDAAITVTTAVPLQKWMYLLVSVDSGIYVDIYLDGKMVKTAVLKNPISGQGATASTTAIPGIVIGPFNGYVSTFNNWGYALDPQTVWSYYMKGNGNSLGTTYGIDMGILKNEEVQSKYRLF